MNIRRTIIEYTAYQCPLCARRAQRSFNQIKDEWVAIGQVRYVFKDLPLVQIHPQAALAAEAARCVGDQDQDLYVTMHDILFENQREWSGSSDAAVLFTAYARELDLDGERFATCLDDHQFEAAVLANMKEAQSLGITGTPAFLINGQPLMGAQPYDIFAQTVDTIIADRAVPTASS